MSILPKDAVMHLAMAWAVGALMAYLAESSRRAVFASHKLALLAAHKEVLESRMREDMQRRLAEAQAQVGCFLVQGAVACVITLHVSAW